MNPSQRAWVSSIFLTRSTAKRRYASAVGVGASAVPGVASVLGPQEDLPAVGGGAAVGSVQSLVGEWRLVYDLTESAAESQGAAFGKMRAIFSNLQVSSINFISTLKVSTFSSPGEPSENSALSVRFDTRSKTYN